MTSLPASVPLLDYTAHGYLDNPWHSAVANRSGVIRSVPPLGFGYWCRRLPWPYGEGARRPVNYLSFLLPALCIDGACFQRVEDFEARGVRLASRYHTKNAMTYEWSYAGVEVRLLYWLPQEHALCCELSLRNTATERRRVSLHATHLYGYPEVSWWGSDGFTSRFNAASDAAVAKIWAYGDAFAFGADRPSTAYKATASAEEWRAWVHSDDLGSNAGAASTSPDPVYSVWSTTFDLPPGEEQRTTMALCRATSEKSALETLRQALAGADESRHRALAEDERFYRQAPQLGGDWPEDWKCGWIYDLEALRMNVRRPLGIFKHHWDAMQIFTPRSVLGEAVLDSMALSYADLGLAKEVILGTFADAPMPNVPCTREDASMNMIGMGGEECGTAPIWVLPFRIIEAIYRRTGDEMWVRELYPHLEAFVGWWLEHRTDEGGWFHCNNSWESGQDGSKRFLQAEGEEGKEAEYVRTVDVEAAMADAMRVLVDLALVAGRPAHADEWRAMADLRVERTRAMYVDGWFRDFDARSGAPIMLPDYQDVMMLLPVSVGIATAEQIEAIRPKIREFVDSPEHWLEWPSFMFCYTEAGWNAGMHGLMAQVVASTADRVYARTHARSVVPVKDHASNLPEPFSYRIPGTANEFWPMEPTTLTGCGSEAYGWGATLPTLILRNIVGFREAEDHCTICPTLPASLLIAGTSYEVANLRWRDTTFDLSVSVSPALSLRVVATRKDGPLVLDQSGVANGTELTLQGI